MALAAIAFGEILGAQAPPHAVAPSRCAPDLLPFSSPYCSELVAVPDLRQVRGMMELAYMRSPFGVAVAPDGRLRHRIVLDIAALPPVDSLGDFRTYVAWGYTLTMTREVRLGVVRNGRNALGELPYDQFRVLVSAERNAKGATRRGKLVMRATSPSVLLLAHRDAVISTSPAARAASAAGAHEGHEGHEGAAWPMPPDDPRLAPMAMTHTEPATAPFRPHDDASLVDARPREVIALRDGDTLSLRASLVRRHIAGRTFVAYGYNGQYPGPLVRVAQGANVVVRYQNAIDLPSTVHWHGVRLDNRFDGVPDLTQPVVAPGDSFVYHLRFPDAGIYWYHPHVREDVQQELGLYGNILVAPKRPRAPVHREEVLMLDDFLLGGAAPVPMGGDTPTHALMGRFGNVLLVNGEPDWSLGVRPGEVVRFYLTNAANARTFNLRIPGVRLKLVGSDLGDFERQEWVESVVIGPAERYVVEAQFEQAGRYALVNAVQWLDHIRGTFTSVEDTMGVVVASGARAPDGPRPTFARLAASADAARELAPLRRQLDRKPDHQLTLGVRTRDLSPLFVSMLTGMAVPLDWNDGMPMMNWPLTGKEIAWWMRDEAGRENMDILWHFRVGETSKIRIVNDPGSMHAMAHPIHFHGQRFAVLARNGVPNDNLVWKDTALLPAGETMDILLELSNPGRWMAHCHIAEHLGVGMMMVFDVQ